MPTGPECEKRPVLGKRRFKPSHRGSLQRSKAGASKDSPPALTSEGDRGRLLPGFWPWPALTLPRIPDRRSLRIGSETTQADVEVAPDVGGRTGIAALFVGGGACAAPAAILSGLRQYVDAAAGARGARMEGAHDSGGRPWTDAPHLGACQSLRRVRSRHGAAARSRSGRGGLTLCAGWRGGLRGARGAPGRGLSW